MFFVTAPKIIIEVATATKINAPLLNSGTDGLLDSETVEVADGIEVGLLETLIVGLGQAEVLEESDNTEIELLAEFDTNISSLSES